MNPSDRFEVLVESWLAEPATLPTGPGIARVREGIRRTPQARGRRLSWPRRSRTLVPALALAVVGAAALAGSVLITGMAPSPTQRLLGRLETAPLAPGVTRVLADSTGRSFVGVPFADVAVGRDGSVWLAPMLGSLYREDVAHFTLVEAFRLDGEEATGLGFGGGEDVRLAVDAEGMPLATNGAGMLATFDGTAWHRIETPGISIRDVKVDGEGSVWAAWVRGDTPGAGRLDADGSWSAIDDAASPATYAHWGPGFAVTSGTDAWLSIDFFHQGPTHHWRGLLRAVGGAWQEEQPLPDRTDLGAGPIAAGSDGTLWVYLATSGTGGGPDPEHAHEPERYLARHDAGGWTVYDRADGVPWLVGGQAWDASLAVDGTGRLWIADLWADDIQLPPDLAEADGGCNGLLSFDGSTWRQYLKDVCVSRVAAAPDGGVWAVAELGMSPGALQEGIRLAEPAGLYFVRPEAIDGP